MNNTENHTDNHESIEEYLPEFLRKYNAESVSEVDCKIVEEKDFERLGDAAMESNHPGESHKIMDAMMGGEGSENLRQMHINMGKAYLDCYNDNRKEASNMGYMMGGNYGGWTNMPMMNRGFGFIWGINGLLVTILLIALIRYFWKKTK